jgi:nucleoside-diphosphate-sugar epimerase
MRKILVTGAAGYIGSVLTQKLLSKKYQVVGIDNLSFGGESLVSIYGNPLFNFVKGDIRDKEFIIKVLPEVTDIVHLAAIVGDPACSKQPDLAREINWEASKMLADIANEYNNINRFVFASTCSNYGKMEGDSYLNEESPLRPVSLYAELKVKFEQYLLSLNKRKDFIPTALRFSTVYGISPRIRFDLTVNEFIREVVLGGKLEIFGEQFWRPYAHVEDLANACVLVLESESNLVDREVFGVGDTRENYQKKMIAEEILKIIPNAKINYVTRTEDPRDYRVDFTKIKDKLGFKITKTVSDGLKEINSLLMNGLLEEPYSKKYQNI